MKARMAAAAGLLIELKGGPLELPETESPLRASAQLQGLSALMHIKRHARGGLESGIFEMDENKVS